MSRGPRGMDASLFTGRIFKRGREMKHDGKLPTEKGTPIREDRLATSTRKGGK